MTKLTSFWIRRPPHPLPRKGPPPQPIAERKFLAGRRPFRYELLRTLRIGLEFMRGFQAMHKIGPAVTLFGSARFKSDHRYYRLAEEVGAIVARQGLTLITGGGPGIMEAASKGAKNAGGATIGCRIMLPFEQHTNAYVDRVITFYYFFVRKVILVKYSRAFIILPGGLGTLDELMEALTLMQTGRLYHFPVICVGVDYWQGLIDWMRERAEMDQTLAWSELSFLHITDDLSKIEKVLVSTVKGT